jgi:hypothetical protein
MKLHYCLRIRKSGLREMLWELGGGSVKCPVSVPNGTVAGGEGHELCLEGARFEFRPGHRSPLLMLLGGLHSLSRHIPALYLLRSLFFPIYYSSTRLRVGPTGVRIPARGFLISKHVQTGSGAHPLPLQWVPVLFPGVKRPERDVNHWPPSSAEDETEWSYTSTPAVCHYDLYGAT